VTAEELRQYVSDALVGCYEDAVDAGVDLAAYNSLENAADVNSIRQALGYDQIVYYGESYGTLLGQHLLRDYPEALSAVVLDGVVPIDAVVYEEKVDERFDYALGQLLDLCAAEAPCAAAYPQLAQDIEAAYEQLAAEPYDLVTQSGATLPIDGVTFAASVFGSLYSPSLSADLPVVVEAVLNPGDDGEVDPAVPRILSGAAPGDDVAQLMHFAVVCAEDPIHSIDEAKSLGSSAPSIYTAFAEADAGDYVLMCSTMDLPVLPDETDQLVSSDTPVLLLHGGLDPATPAYFVADMMGTLPNSYSFVFPYGSHVQGMNDGCSQSITAQFLTDPMTEPDGSCLEDYEPLVFRLPGE
jgi:pimeloyl-ACP methyl ester carboxylesterase